MILKWMALGIPVAGFFAAGAIAAQAAPSPAPETRPGAEAPAKAEKRIIRVRVVKKEEKAGDTSGKEEEDTSEVIDADEIARDVEEAVDEALSEAMEALDKAEADIRVELDGKKLEALSEEHREALKKARERLKGLGDKLAERAAEVEIKVARAAEKAAEAAEEAGETLKEYKVIILRDRGRDAEVKIEKDEKGRTVVVIEGDDVKVITPHKRADEKKKAPKE